jgi:hypothetical protein
MLHLAPSANAQPDRPSDPIARWSRIHRVTATIVVVIVCAIALVSFAGNVHENHFLADDAFISFRYARHLADGLGLVWNPGERVEGYTNFLWVALLAGGMLAGASPEVLSVILGIASGVALLGMLVAFGARRLGWRHPYVYGPVLALGVSRSFTAWCSSGLETRFHDVTCRGEGNPVLPAREGDEPRPPRTGMPWRLRSTKAGRWALGRFLS